MFKFLFQLITRVARLDSEISRSESEQRKQQYNVQRDPQAIGNRERAKNRRASEDEKARERRLARERQRLASETAEMRFSRHCTQK